MFDYNSEFEKITSKMNELHHKKNSNYGNSFSKLWDELGPISGLIPLYNKLHRASNLVKGNQNDFESLEDTFIDLANYAIMNLLEMERTKK